jgi:hypothetical protein
MVALPVDHWFPVPLTPRVPVKAHQAFSSDHVVLADDTYASKLTVHVSAVIAAGGKRVEVAEK